MRVVMYLSLTHPSFFPLPPPSNPGASQLKHAFYKPTRPQHSFRLRLMPACDPPRVHPHLGDERCLGPLLPRREGESLRFGLGPYQERQWTQLLDGHPYGQEVG